MNIHIQYLQYICPWVAYTYICTDLIHVASCNKILVSICVILTKLLIVVYCRCLAVSPSTQVISPSTSYRMSTSEATSLQAVSATEVQSPSPRSTSTSELTTSSSSEVLVTSPPITDSPSPTPMDLDLALIIGCSVAGALVLLIVVLVSLICCVVFVKRKDRYYVIKQRSE